VRAFADVRVQHGLKIAVSGVLAFFCALWLKLEVPVWSILTVLVLSMAQYVGAIGEKAVYRILGTVLGGAAGYILTASLDQDPFIFIPLVALLVGLGATFFGQPRAPYAFYLFGLTCVIVVAEGMSAPEFSWQLALARVQEVVLGVVVSMAVSLLLWPRFALTEFADSVTKCKALLASALEGAADRFCCGRQSHRLDEPGELPLKKLRQLLHFGTRESRYFRQLAPSYSEAVRLLTGMSNRIRLLSSGRYLATHYRELLASPLRQYAESISALLRDSQMSTAEVTARKGEFMNALEDVVRAGRSLREVSARDSRELAQWVLSLNEIAEQAVALQARIEEQGVGMIPPRGAGKAVSPESNTPTTLAAHLRTLLQQVVAMLPDLSWWETGLRSMVAVAVGLVLMNWLHPPGGAMIVLATYTFTARSRVMPGGEGDRRAFHLVLPVGLLGIPFSLLLLLATPLLSSYVAFNILLFSALLIYGYLSFGIPGLSLPMRVSFLTIVGVVGLNAQVPVGFQQVSGLYLGLLLGLLVSAVVRRLILPVLPQRQFQRLVIEWFEHAQHLAAVGPIRIGSGHLRRLGLIPSECRAWLARMKPPEGSKIIYRESVELIHELIGLGASLSTPGRDGFSKLSSGLKGDLPNLLDVLREEEVKVLSLCAQRVAEPQNDKLSLTLAEKDLRKTLRLVIRTGIRLRSEMHAANLPTLSKYLVIGTLDRQIRRGLGVASAAGVLLRLPNDAYADARL